MTPPIRMVSVPVDLIERLVSMYQDYKASDLNHACAHRAFVGWQDKHDDWKALSDALTAAPVREEGGAVLEALDEALIYIEQLGANIERNDLDMHLDTVERPFSFAQTMRGRFPSLCVTREEAPACEKCGGKGFTEYEGGEGEGYPSRPEIEVCSCRGEATAEAGELASQIAILRKAANSPTPDEDAGLTPESALRAAQAWRTIASNVVEAFDRAQPQAREEAQPVADAVEPIERAIAALKGHVSAIQAGKQDGGSSSLITDCINGPPEIVRWIESGLFNVEAAFEQYEDTPPAPDAEKLCVALDDSRAWHTERHKALSKQPPSPDRDWRKAEHAEEIARIEAVLQQEGR